MHPENGMKKETIKGGFVLEQCVMIIKLHITLHFLLNTKKNFGNMHKHWNAVD